AAAGSLPGDLQRVWRNRAENTYHVEYGYSCMGYEVNAALGVKLAQPQSGIDAPPQRVIAVGQRAIRRAPDDPGLVK
ncbi:hypothetical protein LAN17_25365, partial [Mycobacterium tuberculosis]|nr:hypothetical protein [Mycobacterium tuberculosis]